jgi:hypothetical protein
MNNVSVHFNDYTLQCNYVVIYTVSEKDCTLFFIYLFFEKGTIFFGHSVLRHGLYSLFSDVSLFTWMSDTCFFYCSEGD